MSDTYSYKTDSQGCFSLFVISAVGSSPHDKVFVSVFVCVQKGTIHTHGHTRPCFDILCDGNTLRHGA